MSTLAPPTAPTIATEAAPSRAGRRAAWVAVGLAAVVLACLASVAWGTRSVSGAELLGGLGGSPETLAEAAVAKRVPRTLLAVLVGAALGLAGAAMQGVTRNPLADPGLLGVTSGAALAVVVGIAFFGLGSPSSYLWVAVAGAAGAATLVAGLGAMGRGRPSPLRLVLAGAVCSAAFSSLTAAVLLPRVDVMNEFRFWQVGGVGGATYERIGLVLPFLAVGAALCVAGARGLNALALGDDLAAGLGERVGRVRAAAAAGSVVLTGAATAVAGPIGFVGLVVPHAVRLVAGSDHRWVLPLAAIAGATLLTVADVVGRVVARPAEVDVGIVTALVGGPVFVLLVRRLKVRSL